MIKFKTYEQIMREDAERDFENVLARLPGWVGHRHVRLPLVVRKGRQAAHTDAEIYDAILANCGEPRLDESEVRQALSVPTQPGAAEHRPAPEDDATTEERQFVLRMVIAGWGTTIEDLQKAAGLQPTSYNRCEALARHVQAIAGTEAAALDRLFYVGDKWRGDILPAKVIIERDNDFWPHIIPNALTGEAAPTKDGTHLTLRGDANVVAPRLLLIEFDEMPYFDQLRFWGGVLKCGTLRVVSLVYSGNKSFHGLVEVEGDYSDFVAKVRRLCCSADDPRYRCDRAVLHPSALTRLAGAVRAIPQEDDPNTKTLTLQELVWAFRGNTVQPRASRRDEI